MRNDWTTLYNAFAEAMMGGDRWDKDGSDRECSVVKTECRLDFPLVDMIDNTLMVWVAEKEWITAAV